ncbi:MAG: hypothetical protein ACRD1B_05295, partial [Thermoanaerobaculia bacterium]
VQLDDHHSLDLFLLVRSTIANPWLYAFYVAGIVSATFHFAYGLSTFAIVWGITVGPKAQRRMIGVSVAVFVILSAIGLRSIAAFRM